MNLDMFTEELDAITEARLDVVSANMQRLGITNYSTFPTTSDAIQVSYGRVVAYYIFDGLKLKDIWID